MDKTINAGPAAFWSKPIMLMAVIFLLGTGIFLPTLTYDFVWDDHILIQDNPQIKSLSNAPRIFLSDFHLNQYSSFYRPLVIFSFALDYALYQGHAWGYHLSNAILHGLNSSLVTYLALLLFSNPYIALIAGAFFALHPAHPESVAFISGRTDLLATFFSLLALVAIIKKSKPDNFFSSSLLASGFFFLALLSKETSVVILIPLALGLYQCTPEPSKKITRVILKVMPSLMILLLYLTFRYVVLKSFFMKYELKLFHSPFFIPELFWRYLSYLALPLQQASFLYHNFGQAYLLTTPRAWFWAGLTLLLLWMMGYGIYRYRESMPLFALWLLPCLPSLYYSLHGDTIMVERYLYLPSAGLALLLAWGLTKIPAGGKKWAAAGALLLLAAYLGISLWRIPLWKNEVVLFEGFKKEYPAVPYVRFSLGSAYMERNQLPQAYEELSFAAAREPQHPFYRNNLGWLYLRMGKAENARQEFAAVLDIAPNFALALEGMGVAYVQERNYESALKYLDTALLAEPQNQTALLYKNFALSKLNQPVR